MKKTDNLESLNKFKIELGLEKIIKLMNLLENPEKTYKIIHIAGTNGKGSTASFIESGLMEAGYVTGKYTSPEIFKFNERITVNKTEISDKEVENYFDKVNQIIKKNNLELTYFEVTTAMMFLYMKEKEIDYLVLETGLGGRLDATNVVTPVVSLITNISYDHMNFLGDTLKKIAFEKAGIIKKNIPVFFSDETKELKQAIKEKTENSTNVLEKYSFSIDNVNLDIKNLKTLVRVDNDIFELSLFGKFQAKNFLLAYETLKYLGIHNEIIKKSCKNVVWKGRFEIVSQNPFIVLDGAHNKASAAVLAENLEILFQKDEILFIVSVLKDKDVSEIVKELGRVSDDVIFTGIDNERGFRADEMFDFGKNYFKNPHKSKNIKQALKDAEFMNKKVIVICGSFYLLKEYRKEEIKQVMEGR